MDKNWFQTFIVLKIYNTTKKKYRKLFTPLKGKEYTYELEYAGGQMLQIRKKLWERNDYSYSTLETSSFRAGFFWASDTAALSVTIFKGGFSLQSLMLYYSFERISS